MSTEKPPKATPRLLKYPFCNLECAFLTVFIVAYLLIGLASLTDYGLTWDESWENHYGDKTLNYLLSFDEDHLDFSKRTVTIYDHPLHPDFYDATTLYLDNDLLTQPHLVWPLAPVLSSICKYLFFDIIPVMSAIDAHHLAPLLGGLVLALGLFAFSYRYFGRWAAIIATLALTLHPRWYAHCHFNPKDVLSTVFFSLTIFAFYHAMAERRLGFFYVSAVMCGLALATKANALFLPVIVLPYFIAELVARRNERNDDLARRSAAQRLKGESAPVEDVCTVVTKPEVLAWALYPLIAIGVMFALWPLLWQDFPNNVVKYVDSLFNRGYSGEETGWNMFPLRYAFGTLPLVYLVFMLMGLRSRLFRKDRLNPINLLLAMWLTVPIARVMVPGANDFDGIRHWLEWVPAMALLAGAGGGGILILFKRALEKRQMAAKWIITLQCLIVMLFFTPLTVWLTRNHPYQLAYFNPAVGGLSGAVAKGYPDAGDYWGSSYRKGVEWMNAHAKSETPFLVVGVAEHLALYYFDAILDEPISYAPSQVALRMMAASPERPIYMMRINREFTERQIVGLFDQAPVVHEITVDGVTILEIRRFDNYNAMLKANGR